jgi:prepilin-type N-terminal cleavage/methylation domain-containing protein
VSIRRNPALEHGYTAVELMMSIAIFGIGITGIASMQRVVAVSNTHAKSLSIATHVAESWLDMLSADATQWNRPAPNFPTSDRADTAWLTSVSTNPGSGGWIKPSYSANFGFGPYFDTLGNPLPTATNAEFCANIRLSWLYPEASGNGLIRADVRVYWLRDGQTSVTAGTNPCAETPDAITGGATRYHFVQKTTTLRENTQPQP